jgi:hypothetical protein
MTLFKQPWFRTRTFDTANEGEGGGAAPNADARTAALESRLSEMATSLDSMLARTARREHDAQRAGVERNITGAVETSQNDLDAAETALAEAIEEGDSVALARAQRKLAQAAAKVERIDAEAAGVRSRMKNEAERREGGASGAPRSGGEAPDTTNLDAWKARHATWYGVNAEMTQAAHEIDGQIRRLNVLKAGSPEYFQAIDERMRNKFRDQFQGSPASASGGQGGGPAPSGGGGGTRIPKHVVDAWRKMRIPVDQPGVLERMAKHRQTAVDKNFLPAQPRYGEVINH